MALSLFSFNCHFLNQCVMHYIAFFFQHGLMLLSCCCTDAPSRAMGQIWEDRAGLYLTDKPVASHIHKRGEGRQIDLNLCQMAKVERHRLTATTQMEATKAQCQR